MNEVNNRHIKLLNDLIKSYELGQIQLNSFVNQIESIIWNFESPPKHWLEKMKNCWTELEVINALELSKNPNRSHSNNENNSDIPKILTSMKKLLDAYASLW